MSSGRDYHIHHRPATIQAHSIPALCYLTSLYFIFCFCALPYFVFRHLQLFGALGGLLKIVISRCLWWNAIYFTYLCSVFPSQDAIFSWWFRPHILRERFWLVSFTKYQPNTILFSLSHFQCPKYAAMEKNKSKSKNQNVIQK